MTAPELLQLYAPLVGLLGLAFWVGMLSQKVADQKEDIAALRTSLDGMKEDHDEADMTERLVRLEVTLENGMAEIAKMGRSMEGVQRQLGNLMQKPGSVTEFRHD
jgi:hypothetical protein